ncbi:MAG: hypothetical protein WD231_04265 [Candidatus Woykebacteria bacterium]
MTIKSKPYDTEKAGFKKIGDVIKERIEKKGPVYAKYEFQDYGVRLSEELHDQKHKALYIKFAKEKPRPLLEEARAFARDYNTKSLNRGKIFMWKLADLEKGAKTKKR